MPIDPFAPLTIGPITLRNHFIRAGANEMMTRGSLPTKSLLKFHEALAHGGTGMTTLAYVAISPDGRTFASQGVLSAQSVPHYRAITDAVHAGGAKACAQITHGGSFVQHKELSTPRAMSSSGGLDKMGLMIGRPLQRQMNRADMDQVRDEFVAAARRAAEAGFDAVEIHMGHGYLLNQFLSPLSNFRRDEYGGSAENRARFPTEVLAAVKRAVGERMAVLAKINLHDGVRKGATVADAIVTARALQDAGADMLVLSAGRNMESPGVIFGSAMPYADLAGMKRGLVAKLQFLAMKWATARPPVFRENYLMTYAEQLKDALGPDRRVKLGFVGGVQSLDGACDALERGFDGICMARALLNDPALIGKWEQRSNQPSACTACNRCVAAMYGPAGTHCPEVGNAIDPAFNLIAAGAAR